jgi:uncharacterized protein (TIGR03067 family)
VALVVAAGCGPKAENTAPARTDLDGTYEVLRHTLAGYNLDADDSDKRVEIRGGRMTVHKRGRQEDAATLTLDPTKRPARVTITPTSGEPPVEGIYDAKDTDRGVELTIAYTRSPGTGRPKDFKPDVEYRIVIQLLRKK